MEVIDLKDNEDFLNEVIVPLSNLNVIDSSDLMKEPKRKNKWLINNLLHTAGTSLWAGKQKVGKTTLIRQLSLSVAIGKEFLGREVRKGLVLYLALEEDRDEIKEHLTDMGHPDGSKNLLFHVGAISGNPFEAVKRYIEDVKPALVIIDTLIKFTKIKDLNNYSLVVEKLEPLTELARKNECHILFVHHMNKGISNGQDKILGSVGILGSLDTIATLTREDEDRCLETIQRYGRSFPKSILSFNDKRREYTVRAIVGKSEIF